MHAILLQTFTGLSLGLVYVLLAMGLNLILGLMGVVNFVHGAFFMFGAFITFTFAKVIGFWPAVLVGAAAVAVIGLLFEIPLIRPMYQRIPEHGLLLTYGLAAIMEQVSRMIWGDYPQSVSAPTMFSGSVNLGFMQFPKYRFLVMILTIVVIGLVWLFLTKTNFGMVVRAGIEDRLMVGILGINLPVTFTIVYSIGAGLGALAGALASPLYGVYPSMGGDFIIYAFIVVIVGGIGSFWGTVLAGLLVGVVQALVVMWWSPGSLLSSFIIMALVLLIRPRGFFGIEGVLD